MNITLTVVVAAIVILITALVVITIFGSGIQQVGGIAQARSLCGSQCQATCQATGQKPVTWDVTTVRDESGALSSCQKLVGDCSCPNQQQAVTYTCTQTSGQTCETGAACPAATKQPASGTCPQGKVCCKPNSY